MVFICHVIDAVVCVCCTISNIVSVTTYMFVAKDQSTAFNRRDTKYNYMAIAKVYIRSIIGILSTSAAIVGLGAHVGGIDAA